MLTVTKGDNLSQVLKSLADPPSIIAALQNKIPGLRTPEVPRLFHEEVDLFGSVENVDILGEPFTSASFRPPLTPGIPNAICDLTILQNEIIIHNENILQSGSEDDLPTRRGLYKKLRTWRKSLPEHLLNELNRTPGTSLLRCAYIHNECCRSSAKFCPGYITKKWPSLHCGSCVQTPDSSTTQQRTISA